MSILALAAAGISGGGGLTIPSGWADIGPGATPQSNANVTLSGGTGTITTTNSGSGLAYYDLNSAGFASYSGGFSASGGQTLRWQIESLSGNVTGTIEVFADGVSLDTFTYDVTA